MIGSSWLNNKLAQFEKKKKKAGFNFTIFSALLTYSWWLSKTTFFKTNFKMCLLHFHHAPNLVILWSWVKVTIPVIMFVIWDFNTRSMCTKLEQCIVYWKLRSYFVHRHRRRPNTITTLITWSRDIKICNNYVFKHCEDWICFPRSNKLHKQESIQALSNSSSNCKAVKKALYATMKMQCLKMSQWHCEHRDIHP